MAEGKEELNAPRSIKIATSTPAAHMPVSRGFYQAEEDSLYVPVYPAAKFFSYLDSDQVIFDIDAHGRLIFIQVLMPRRHWRVRDNLKLPMSLGTADIRFLDFRERLPQARIETFPDYSSLHLIFNRKRAAVYYNLADNILVGIAADSTLADIWISAIEDDRAARGMSAWRKSLKSAGANEDEDSPFTRIEIRRSHHKD